MNNYNSVIVSDEFSIDRAVEALGAVPSDVKKAVGSAIKRAGASGITFAAKAVQEQYRVSTSTFKKYTWAKTRWKSSKYITTTELEYCGYHIPLIRFDTSADKSGRIKTRVKQSSAKTLLDHIFMQRVGEHGHIGTFERKAVKKLPIEEKLGPSGVQMMYSNEAVMDSIVDKVKKTYDKRLEHEITAILNGWRKEPQTRLSLEAWADINR